MRIACLGPGSLMGLQLFRLCSTGGSVLASCLFFVCSQLCRDFMMSMIPELMAGAYDFHAWFLFFSFMFSLNSLGGL